MPKTDLIIIGGGVIGSSIAYHLLKDGFNGEITVFEKDRLYEFASTPRSAGGIRQLFTTPINIQISRYSLNKYLTDRKSTRLNSSHVAISYAVFCLKKKNKNNDD